MKTLSNERLVEKDEHWVSKYLQGMRKDSSSIEVKGLRKTVSDTTVKLHGFSQGSFVPNGVWLTGAHMLWEQGYTGKGCVVGVIDSGVDSSHPDLKNQVKKRISYVGDEDYLKLAPHGTHVAGTICANGFLKGVAPDATVLDYRVFGPDDSTTNAIIEKAIYQAADDGCNVINMSIGRPFGDKALEKAIKYAHEKGALVVVAVGNEGEYIGWDDIVESYPANHSSVLSVAAVDYIMDEGEIRLHDTKFSNRNKEVDLCADGYRVLSTVPKDGYAVFSGTSMACPHASGFAALMYEKARFVTKNTEHTYSELYAITKSCTVPIYVGEFTPDENKIDNITGAGLITAFPEIPQMVKEYYLPTLQFE